MTPDRTWSQRIANVDQAMSGTTMRPVPTPAMMMSTMSTTIPAITVRPSDWRIAAMGSSLQLLSVWRKKV
jgi:hypothetical protein